MTYQDLLNLRSRQYPTNPPANKVTPTPSPARSFQEDFERIFNGQAPANTAGKAKKK